MRGTRGPAGLGAEPRDGDFARLLEAASEPAAHNLRVPAEVNRFTGRIAAGRAAAAGPATGRTDSAFGHAGAGRHPTGAPGEVTRSGGTAGPRPPASPGEVAAADDRSSGLPAPVGDALAQWSRRSPRDRVVAMIFAFAVLWIVVAVVAGLFQADAPDLGPLFVLAVVAFFVLRNRFRSRGRPPRSP
jgi:hypothetical protein